MNRKDLQVLSRLRLSEAKGLLSAVFPDGAYYLAGYSVECALKACIAKETQRHDFPDKRRTDRFYMHNLTELITPGNLDVARSEKAGADPVFRDNWNVVHRWSERSRYARTGAEIALGLVTAIGDRKHGVITWIRRHW